MDTVTGDGLTLKRLNCGSTISKIVDIIYVCFFVVVVCLCVHMNLIQCH